MFDYSYGKCGNCGKFDCPVGLDPYSEIVEKIDIEATFCDDCYNMLVKKYLKYPAYVFMLDVEDGYKVALKLHHYGDRYERVAGAWCIGFEETCGVMVTTDSSMEHMNGKVLVPCTKKEHDKDNEGFV